MKETKHIPPSFTLAREPRPGDRETRMYPLPGKWMVRAQMHKGASEG